MMDETMWNLIPKLVVWALVTFLLISVLRFSLHLLEVDVQWGIFENVNRFAVALFL